MAETRNRKIGLICLALVFVTLLVAALPPNEVAYAVFAGQVLPSESEIPDVSKIIRGFDPPAHNWLPGHRGIDLASSPGAPVVAVRAGTIRFAGPVARVGVISIGHGDGTRTTYQPVTPSVRVGQRVSAGQEIGKLNPGHCPKQACLHLGYRRGDTYLDPTVLLVQARREVRLLPSNASPNPHLMSLTADPKFSDQSNDLPKSSLPTSGPGWFYWLFNRLPSLLE